MMTQRMEKMWDSMAVNHTKFVQAGRLPPPFLPPSPQHSGASSTLLSLRFCEPYPLIPWCELKAPRPGLTNTLTAYCRDAKTQARSQSACTQRVFRCVTARHLLAVPSDTSSALQERWTTQLNEVLLAAVKEHVDAHRTPVPGCPGAMTQPIDDSAPETLLFRRACC